MSGRCHRSADGAVKDPVGTRPLLPVFHIGKLVTKGADSSISQLMTHSLHEGVPHARARTVSEHANPAGVIRHRQYGRDISIGLCNVELQLRYHIFRFSWS